ncbi:MAG: YdcF family protein [Sedimentisphaerales bacterium]|nr:YdcF family protein [Sedimentisphaerales bacterium]
MAEDQSIRNRPPIATAAARGLALFFGGFSLLNLLGEMRYSGFDANSWWIDLRFLAPWPARALLAATAVLLIGFAANPSCRPWRRVLTFGAAALLATIALANAVAFWLLTLRGAVAAGCPVPLSLVVAALMALLAGATLRPPNPQTSSRSAVGSFVMGATVAACLAGFPVAQMCCFGTTDYRREADAAVVLGARVYADGHPSLALADRVRTACALYRDGLVRRVIVSGGPGDGPTHETEAMRRLAMQLGVASDDILVDAVGLNTEATVRNTCTMFERHGAERVIVVSHFYHLPRIKLTYARHGREVYTVPADETRMLVRLPWYMAREVAALWVYYLRPLRSA